MRFDMSSVLFLRAPILSTLALCGAQCSVPVRAQQQPLAPPVSAVSPIPDRPSAVPLWRDKVEAEDPHLPDVAKARHLCSVVQGVYSVCVETDGSVGSVQPIQSIRDADDALIGTLSKWRFRPQRERSCYPQKLEFHIDGANGCAHATGLPDDQQLTADEALAQRLGAAEEPSLSDGNRAANLCGRFSAVYRITIGNTGRVWAARAASSTPGEPELVRALETWTFPPRAAPAVFDHTVRLNILCDGTEERISQTGEVLARSAPRQRLAAADAILAEKLSTNDAPRLSPDAQKLLQATRATYFLCVGRDGIPDSVDAMKSIRAVGSRSWQDVLRAAEHAVMKTLLGWRFKPRTERTCFAQTLSFSAE